MKPLFSVLSAVSVVLVSSFAMAEDFPTAPANLKEVEAQGLPRLSNDELKGLFPGTIDSKGVRGRHTLVLKPDGSVDREGKKMSAPQEGKWRIEEDKNAYCLAFNMKKGYEDNCFAVFRAPDGTYFFDYDIKTGFYAHVWRKTQ